MARVHSALRLWQRFKRYVLKLQIGRYPIIPILIILAFATSAIFGELLAPYSAIDPSLPNRLLPPFFLPGGSMAHPLGTDDLGRDILSRIIVGARVSFIVALLAIVVGGFGGSLLGTIASYSGGRLDAIVMRTADATLAFPFLFLAILLSVALGPSIQNVVIAISIYIWAQFARTVRGDVLKVRELDFVAQAKTAGCSGFRILVRHILPNIQHTIVIMLTLQIGWVILAEASLSFLGAGIPPPTPAWGSMVARGRDYITLAWWVPALPGLAILLVCLAFNLTGDWLREALDPKLRQAAQVRQG